MDQRSRDVTLDPTQDADIHLHAEAKENTRILIDTLVRHLSIARDAFMAYQ